jgi:ABC-type dipeptide/oligopeptide/nickel transport system ATPase component
MDEIIQKIRSRLLRKNQSMLLAITGPPGSGKSYSACKICQDVDPTFDVSRIVFSMAEFMRLLNSGALKKGSAVLIDEGGIFAPNREWFSTSNKVFNYVAQSFRRENLLVVFATPSLKFIDIQTQRLFNAYAETISINHQENHVVVKFFEMVQNPRIGKIYFRYPVIMRDGQLVTIDQYLIGKPSEELIEPYEQKKKAFVDSLKLDAEKTVMREKIKAEEKAMSPSEVVSKIVEEIEKNLESYTSEYRGWKCIDDDLIAERFNVGGRVANRAKKAVESRHPGLFGSSKK